MTMTPIDFRSLVSTSAAALVAVTATALLLAATTLPAVSAGVV
jgi:hypothetical protein